jgi:hypothetical protein
VDEVGWISRTKHEVKLLEDFNDSTIKIFVNTSIAMAMDITTRGKTINGVIKLQDRSQYSTLVTHV